MGECGSCAAPNARLLSGGSGMGGGEGSIKWLVSLQDGTLGWHYLGLNLQRVRIVVFNPGWIYPSAFGCLALHIVFVLKRLLFFSYAFWPTGVHFPMVRFLLAGGPRWDGGLSDQLSGQLTLFACLALVHG